LAERREHDFHIVTAFGPCMKVGKMEQMQNHALARFLTTGTRGARPARQ
jgi:hypothetical protein